MSTVTHSKKSCAVNPLKMSQPIGAALAFLGLDKCMPLLHGSQGCTAFGLVLFVRHFRETIPLQTSAMNEVTTILGGLDNLEQAILNIYNRAKPEVIGICSTGLTETKGDDVEGYLKLIRERHPELADTSLVFAPTPDYSGAFQDGWGKAVKAVVEAMCEPRPRTAWQVNVLPGCHLTVADIEELREIIESFGLFPIIAPDLSGSLDGHIPETFLPTTIGGAKAGDIREMGGSAITIAIGEQMRDAAEALQEKTGVPYRLFDRLTGLEANDEFMKFLSEISLNEVAVKYRRQRGQLVDAMLDGHFHLGGKTVAVGAEPDLLWQIGNFLSEMGCEISAAVTTTTSPLLEKMPAAEVLIGDLEDLESRAAGCDLLITHSHGRQAAERLAIPFYRYGLPTFDRLGATHKLSVGYRGTRDLIFEIGNIFLDHLPHSHPDEWALPGARHETLETRH
ncbi:MAG: nitrogenase iron-molybdenum cofactor biosynthesis protein NifN [Sulfuricella sp.]|nr:nitrogenase iron-molybdenum cofactor biosynthesis protein NifN [Sulfuricella sp.]